MNEFKLILFALAAIFAIIVIQEEIGGDDVPNNEPYTGLCVEPMTQGGC